MADPPVPLRLTAVAPHWHAEGPLAELVAKWPADPRWELVVVDNGSAAPLPAPREGVRVLTPGRNLGFAGAVNLGMRVSGGEVVLLLNPDAHPAPGALDALLDGFDRKPEAAGLVPRLVGPDGAPQLAWQLRPLPTPGQLLLQALLLDPVRGARTEPAPGTPVAQPAAAALALRRSVLEAVGGLDPRFHPAWFEDVDLARRLAEAGHRLLYWPAAVFHHQLGSTVPALGYGPFLRVYYRNLCRYLAKHHGRGWAAAVRSVLPVGLLLRLVLLPLRRPRRAASRREAAAGLLGTALAAASGWRWGASGREQ